MNKNKLDDSRADIIARINDFYDKKYTHFLTSYVGNLKLYTREEIDTHTSNLTLTIDIRREVKVLSNKFPIVKEESDETYTMVHGEIWIQRVTFGVEEGCLFKSKKDALEYAQYLIDRELERKKSYEPKIVLSWETIKFAQDNNLKLPEGVVEKKKEMEILLRPGGN